MTHPPATEALAIGSIIASNPPGPRPSHFKVLGNSQRGFQVWLSRDALSWLPLGDCHTRYADLATAFAESYPRPATIHDPVVAEAYAAKAESRPW
jgi:hypothetical protein